MRLLLGASVISAQQRREHDSGERPGERREKKRAYFTYAGRSFDLRSRSVSVLDTGKKVEFFSTLSVTLITNLENRIFRPCNNDSIMKIT